MRYFAKAEEEKRGKEVDKAVKEAVAAASAAVPRPLAAKTFPDVKPLLRDEQMRIVVTGGAGFVGSHLVDFLMLQGHYVYVLDNCQTGVRSNIEHWIGHRNFSFTQHDVTEPFMLDVDRVYHLACPASPPHYQADMVRTLMTGVVGTYNALEVAQKRGARFLLTSTSEVYGDPEVHPQPESYWGRVNSYGSRSCYDEGKRAGEALAYSYREQRGVDVRIARIFNTYGPRMDARDGRVVSNFICQAIRGEKLTIYGTGKQTRSFQYVSDLVRGLVSLMEGSYDGPVNLGNPQERSIGEFATVVADVASKDGVKSGVALKPKPSDDPMVRRPDVTLARKVIGWQPQVTLEEGLKPTVEYFRSVLGDSTAAVPGDGVWIPKDTKVSTPEDPDPVAAVRVVEGAPISH